jgi:hypothetical protein
LDQTGYEVSTVNIINEKDHPEFPAHIYYIACHIEDQSPEEADKTTTDKMKWIKPEELDQYFTSSLDEKVKNYLSQ